MAGKYIKGETDLATVCPNLVEEWHTTKNGNLKPCDITARCNRKEKILSATFSGIGGCGEAQIQTYILESSTFEMQTITGMLELVSLTGNVITDDKYEYYHHTHALFSYKDGGKHCIAAGHIKKIVVSYTAEIELRPVTHGVIRRKYDEETGTGFWDFMKS